MIVDNEATQKIIKWAADTYKGDIVITPAEYDGPLASNMKVWYRGHKFAPIQINQWQAIENPDAIIAELEKLLPRWIRSIRYYGKKHMFCPQCNQDALSFFAGTGKMKFKCTDEREGIPCIWAFIDWAVEMKKRTDKKDADADTTAS